MMELSGDMPVTLIIKAPNQHMADQTIDCMLGWTIHKLKRHLEIVYPTKPKHNEQRLIYSGKLLQDHLTLKEILHQYDSSLLSPHTVHLVCSAVTDTSPQAIIPCLPPKSIQATASSSMGNPSSESIRNSTEELRYRGHAQLSEQINSPGSVSAYAAYMRGAVVQGDTASYTPEQYAWFLQQQQAYSQYMMHYMMYYQNLYSPGTSFNHLMSPSTFQEHAIGNSHPQQPVPQAQEAAVVNNGVQEAGRPNLQMNAQGGMEEEDEEEGEPRDLLHHMYFFMRILTFVGILFFYSTLTRFFVVCAGSFAVYFLQKFRKYMRRSQQQRRREQDNQQQQPEEQQADVRNQEVQEDVQQPQPETDTDQQQAVVGNDSRITRMFAFTCNTVQSFFTSLLPTPPEHLERN